MSSDVTYEQIALTFPLCMALAFRSEFFHQSIMPFVIGLYILNRNTFYLTDHKYTRGMLLSRTLDPLISESALFKGIARSCLPPQNKQPHISFSLNKNPPYNEKLTVNIDLKLLTVPGIIRLDYQRP